MPRHCQNDRERAMGMVQAGMTHQIVSDHVHAIVGGFTPDNTSFFVMNLDIHFVLAMDVIVCTAGVVNVLRTSVCTSPIFLEADVLWSGREFVMMVARTSKLFKEH